MSAILPSRYIVKQALGIATRRPYHEKVIDHYENPRNVGALDKNDPMVGTGIVGAPACGDVMKLQIKVGSFSEFSI
jgi:NifU-like protein involved in Fe-S cluster formation